MVEMGLGLLMTRPKTVLLSSARPLNQSRLVYIDGLYFLTLSPYSAC
jgi:hypothetical protein